MSPDHPASTPELLAAIAASDNLAGWIAERTDPDEVWNGTDDIATVVLDAAVPVLRPAYRRAALLEGAEAFVPYGSGWPDFAAEVLRTLAGQPTAKQLPTVVQWPDDLSAAIQTRADAATKGPWTWRDVFVRVNGRLGADGLTTADHRDVITALTGSLGLLRCDAEFIAHAREDVPNLLGQLTAARAERDEARALLQYRAATVAQPAPSLSGTVGAWPGGLPVGPGLPVTGKPFVRASLVPGDDWTVDPRTGRSNSSLAFLELCGDVARLIRGQAYVLLNGGASDAARTIVAYLAHARGFAPPVAQEQPGSEPLTAERAA